MTEITSPHLTWAEKNPKNYIYSPSKRLTEIMRKVRKEKMWRELAEIAKKVAERWGQPRNYLRMVEDA